MKYYCPNCGAKMDKSLPARGAWIEIFAVFLIPAKLLSLPARGAWIEIRRLRQNGSRPTRRSPHGERGLKCLRAFRRVEFCVSLPARGAWIEMQNWLSGSTAIGSLPARGAWIEIRLQPSENEKIPGRSPHGERGLKYRGHEERPEGHGSLPARGAWIEIYPPFCFLPNRHVAPRTGSVD